MGSKVYEDGECVGVCEEIVRVIPLDPLKSPVCGLCGRLYIIRVRAPTRKRFYALTKLEHNHPATWSYYIVIKRLEKNELNIDSATARKLYMSS